MVSRMLRFWEDGIKEGEDKSGGFPGTWGARSLGVGFIRRELDYRLGMAGSPPYDPLSPRAGRDGIQQGWMAPL